MHASVVDACQPSCTGNHGTITTSTSIAEIRTLLDDQSRFSISHRALIMQTLLQTGRILNHQGFLTSRLGRGKVHPGTCPSRAVQDGAMALLCVIALLLAASLLAFLLRGPGGIPVDHRSVREAWPISTEDADEKAYTCLKELGTDPALVKLMERYHLRTGSLKELGPHPNYRYHQQEILHGSETIIRIDLNGYNQVVQLMYAPQSANTSEYIALRLRNPPGQ